MSADAASPADPVLVIFDVDGTLVDSQAHIVQAMAAAFLAEGLTPPSRAQTLSIVGLSLPQAVGLLAAGLDAAQLDSLVEGYKDAYAGLRATVGSVDSSPLYPGARATLDHLAAQDHVLLGVATGKSRRGLAQVIEAHGLEGYFLTLQCADDHPSKPHPAMIAAALAETGVAAARAAMVGDTSYDMEMARAAGVMPLGVAWGYHPEVQLRAAGAAQVLPDFPALRAHIDICFRRPA
ncbi:HAD-IA family hydrolase [Mesobaculum littorinae]|uniref:HAD-IA family hydrolase n=1 Tax=Mesobaculum littorinae TaxID=2486419 RepID=UPI001F1EAC9A|nr:HAD-IA family hydrolase [Mesobaculum littorinae]